MVHVKGTEAERLSFDGLYQKLSSGSEKNGHPFWKHKTKEFYLYVLYHENAYGKHHNWQISDRNGFYNDNTKYIAYAPDAESLCPYSNGISFRTNKPGVGWVASGSRLWIEETGYFNSFF